MANEDAYSNIVYSGYSYSNTDVYFGVSKKLPTSVVAKLKEANKILLEDGTYDKILNEWRI